MVVRAVGLAGASLLVLAGCSVTTTTVCVDFADFPSVADAAEVAGLIVVGRVAPAEGTREVYGSYLPLHQVEVEQVLKGELPTGNAAVEVTAAPLTCSGSDNPLPGGDPLDTTERVQLFLSEDDGEYRLITPWDGIVSAPAGQPLAWEPDED